MFGFFGSAYFCHSSLRKYARCYAVRNQGVYIIMVSPYRNIIVFQQFGFVLINIIVLQPDGVVCMIIKCWLMGDDKICAEADGILK